MSDTLDRVKALIARAASKDEEEARTSAVIACRMIREQKLVLSDPRAATADNPFQGVSWRGIEDLGVLVWDFLYRKGRVSSPNSPFTSAFKPHSHPPPSSVPTPTNPTPHSSSYAPHSPRPQPHAASRARSRAWAKGFSDAQPNFDPWSSSFEDLRRWAAARNVDVHDNGDGSYSAKKGFRAFRGEYAGLVSFLVTVGDSDGSDVSFGSHAVTEKDKTCAFCGGPIWSTAYTECRTGVDSGFCCSPEHARRAVWARGRW